MSVRGGGGRSRGGKGTGGGKRTERGGGRIRGFSDQHILSVLLPQTSPCVLGVAAHPIVLYKSLSLAASQQRLLFSADVSFSREDF